MSILVENPLDSVYRRCYAMRIPETEGLSMPKPEAAARMNITVPRTLKKEMDAQINVNWSAVASQAFQDKLIELKSQMEVTNMDEVVERLRASKQRAESEQYQRGLTEGRDWAKGGAEFDELQNLSAWRQSMNEHDWSIVMHDSDGFGAAWFNLVNTIWPERADDRSAVDDFRESIMGDTMTPCTAEFTRGFADGAIEVFEQVKRQL
jgi:hypothetical protein